jgi:Uma2 family endonuclease
MQQLEDTGVAQVFNAPMDVLLDEITCLQPDLVVVRSSRADIVKEANIAGVPDLVVEILSPSHPGNDRFLKRGVYARYRVPEYWIVDPVNGFVTVLRSSQPDRYDLEARFDSAATLTSEEFPELNVPLARVFRSR